MRNASAAQTPQATSNRQLFSSHALQLPPVARLPLDERLVFDYLVERSREVTASLARTREAGQALVRWQVVCLFACLGFEAWAGLLGESPVGLEVQLLALAPVLLQLVALALSVRGAFWADRDPTPVSPWRLLSDLGAEGVAARQLYRTLAESHDAGRLLLGRLQRRFRRSVLAMAVSLALFVVLIVVVSASPRPGIEQVFGEDSLPPTAAR